MIIFFAISDERISIHSFIHLFTSHHTLTHPYTHTHPHTQFTCTCSHLCFHFIISFLHLTFNSYISVFSTCLIIAEELEHLNNDTQSYCLACRYCIVGITLIRYYSESQKNPGWRDYDPHEKGNGFDQTPLFRVSASESRSG